MLFAVSFVPHNPKGIVLPKRMPLIHWRFAQRAANVLGDGLVHCSAQVFLDHPRCTSSQRRAELVRATISARGADGVVMVVGFPSTNTTPCAFMFGNVVFANVQT
jgi:hypothetical protein